MSDKLEELRLLNEAFYKLYGRLYENEPLFLGDKKAVDRFKANLFEQYEAEYRVLKIKFETIEKPALYQAEVRHDILVPRKRLIFFRNRAQKLIDNEVICELDRYFAEREKKLEKQQEALERLLEALDSADQRTTAFDEPLSEQDEPESRERRAIVYDEPQDELEEGKSPESAAPAIEQEAVEESENGGDVAPMQNAEKTKGPEKTTSKAALRGQMSIDDVQTSGQTDKLDGA